MGVNERREQGMCDVFKVEGTKADGRVFVELPNGDEVNLFEWVGMEGVDTLTMYQLVGNAQKDGAKVGAA